MNNIEEKIILRQISAIGLNEKGMNDIADR